MNNMMSVKVIFNGQPPVKVYRLDVNDKYWPHGKHSHEYMQIWYVTKGQCDHLVENGIYHMTAGKLLVIPPLVFHEVKNPSKDCVILGCEFPMEVVLSDNIIEKYVKSGEVFRFAYIETFESIIKSTRPCYAPSAACKVEIEQLLNTMIKAYDKKQIYFEAELKADLLKLLVAISRDYNNELKDIHSAMSYEQDMQLAVEYIKSKYRDKLYINDVAKKTSMCLSYFSYFFKEYTGKTFIEYINSLRLEKAKELLATSDHSLENICEETGFNNVAYFAKVFKNEENITPGKYRRLRK